MILYTGRNRITIDDKDSDNFVITLNDQLICSLNEAVAGPLGYVVRVKHDANGKPIVQDDQVGSVMTETIYGDVKFFTHEEQP